MKSRIQFVSGLVVAAMLAGMVMAEGDAAKKEDGAKKESAPKAKTYKGTLAAKPADAAADVVAVLTVKGKEKETVYNVTAADQAVAAKITELLAKGGDIAIKGIASEDGKSIAAAAAAVAPVKNAGGQGGEKKAPKAEKAPAVE